MDPLKTRYRIDGMDCGGCAAKIETAVRRCDGVTEVVVSVAGHSMMVEHDPKTDLTSLTKRVKGLGYGITAAGGSLPEADNDHAEPPSTQHDKGHGSPGHVHDHGEPIQGPWWKTTKARLMLASGAAFAVALIVSQIAPGLGQWPFTAAMLIGLIPIGRRAFMAALSGTPFSIEMLMTIAAIGAVFLGASEEGAAVVSLFLVGELLEGVAAGKARASIQALTKLVPKTAFIEKGDGVIEVPAETLAVDDVILVRPGDRIPADGVIVSGGGSVDEAPVTGESTPVHKAPGDQVFAGTVNADAALHVRVTAAAADNTIARVVKLVEEAQESKAPTERFIDRFSTFYTPAVVLAAAAVAVVPPLMFGGEWQAWIYKGLAILLIGCPCALVISTPAAIAASLSAGARRGLLLKGGTVLESLGKITLAAFDKTGTLTEGKPQVTDVLAFSGSEADVLRDAAALETGSSHPLASAILARAAADKIALPKVADAAAVGGKGVTGTIDGTQVFLGSAEAASAQVSLSPEQASRINELNHEGKSVSVLLRGGTVLGAIAMRDEPRPDAMSGLAKLKAMGVRTVMLTGDNPQTAEAIGQTLGIEVRAGLLPQDKQAIIREFQAQGFKVAKVGDGINDAPALAAAEVGIAMGGGTDVALETAGAAVLHGRVGDVAAMITLSKRTMGNIGQNITIALGLKAVFLVTTVMGITGLWPAILADTGATVLVTMNAMRLLRSPKD
ncbi:MAG: cadmium-translocating P-type ATPase [Phenylobacterium sp.]|uniref:heavy metal translocating P-type ATPase n=1 Tax=Phenylobacterium sp. TaxID=1871053 RepID=UPI001B7880CF|nr:heavy metal translocating P-type ATPase [Phenylobacterium sp.]MBP7817099.1 cadmium-translocating P-type ATPase [Phenylobacterium sp.]